MNPAVIDALLYAGLLAVSVPALRLCSRPAPRVLTVHDQVGLISGAVLLMYAVALAGFALAPWVGASLSAAGPAPSAAITWLQAATLVALGPVTEEVAFRGVLLRSLLGRLPTLAVLTLVSFAWAAVHLPSSGQAVLVYAGLGLVLTGLAMRTGRLLPSVIAHAAYNAVPAGLVLLG